MKVDEFLEYVMAQDGIEDEIQEAYESAIARAKAK